MIESTASRTSGAETTADAGTNSVTLTEPTDVRLSVAREDIASMTQVGDDLIIEMLNGEVVTVENFFAEGVVGAAESQIFLEGAVSPLNLTASGLVGAGGGLLGGVGGAALGLGAAGALASGLGGADNLSPAEIALDLINAFDGTDVTTAPSVADYIAAGVEGVTAETLADVNAAVAASSNDSLAVEDLQAIAGAAVASDLINGYDGTDPTAAPTAEDYTAAGVDTSGATDEQIAALNEAVAASEDADLTAEELQGMLDGILAEDAVELINGYDGTDATTAPTAEDYSEAGVDMEGVTDEQLAALNGAVAASEDTDLTAEEVQAMVDEIIASDLINGYDGTDATTAPSADDYTAAGVDTSGATDEQISALNEAVAASEDTDLTAEELQAMVDEIIASDLINGYDGTDATTAPTAEDYTAAGVDMTDVTDEQLAALNEAVAASADEDLTVEELQDMIDAIVAVDAIVEAVNDADAGTNPTVENFADANVTGVDETNIDAINSYIAGLPEGAIDSTEELQTAVDQINAAIAEQQAEALDQINAWNGTEDLATVGQSLEDAGITDTIVPGQFLVDEGLENALLEAVQDAVVANEGDLTAEELQALVDSTTAGLLVENMNQFDEAATATALDALGVTGVMESNQTEVFDAVQAAIEANPNLADSVEELQAIVDQTLAGLEQDSLDVINAYGADDQANPEPTLDDYLNAAGMDLPEDFAGWNEDQLNQLRDSLNEEVAATEGGLTAEDVAVLLQGEADNIEASLGIVQAYADDPTQPAPTSEDFAAAGVVLGAGNNIVNAVLADAISSGSVTTTEEVQALADAALAFTQGIATEEQVALLGDSGDITQWDTSGVTDLRDTFRFNSDFNEDISGWDTSNVSDMANMFRDASSFNQDISGWDVSNVGDFYQTFNGASSFNSDISGWTPRPFNMTAMFKDASSFNQDIGEWDVSDVWTLHSTFSGASAFDQDLGGWDISTVRIAPSVFNNSGMSVANIDSTLNGWATIDTAAGETGLNALNLGTGFTYSDATAFQHLADKFLWTISGTGPAAADVGDNAAADTVTLTAGQTYHGLGGDDVISGIDGSAETIFGGAGNDTLTGGTGSDIFDYGHSDAGSDTITDFTTGAGGDILDLSDLLIGFENGVSDISNWVTASANGDGDTVLQIDEDAAGPNTDIVQITLTDVTYVAGIEDTMFADGNIMVV